MDTRTRHATKYPILAKVSPKLLGVENPVEGLEEVTKAIARMQETLSEMQKLAKSYRTAVRWGTASLPGAVDENGVKTVDARSLSPRQLKKVLGE